MFKVNNYPLELDAIRITDADRKVLSTTPPTSESLARAKELGNFLGQLLGSNTQSATDSNIVAMDLIGDPSLNAPAEIRVEFLRAQSASFSNYYTQVNAYELGANV